MSWTIKVEHVDDKTGEYIAHQTMLSDELVKYAKVDSLEYEFRKIVDTINLHLKGSKS